jgi:Tfp pilus assembly protein PilX
MSPRAQSGSAYLIVLLVLVVLTIVGLSLVLITQTEMQIGTNERIGGRTLYSADAGIGIATARVLVSNDFTARTSVLEDASRAGAQRIGQVLDQSPFVPILDAPCNLCMINQGSAYSEVNHAVTVRARRVSWDEGATEPDADSPVLGEKTVAAMVEIQPTEFDENASREMFIAIEEGEHSGTVKW